MESPSVAIHWFRKGLRLHDNPALLEACRASTKIYPVFCIDPYFAKPDIVGVNRYSFLLESLVDLDRSLKLLGSRLFVVKGKPEEVLPLYAHKWKANLITFEKDSEPYAIARDQRISQILRHSSINTLTCSSHTIHDLQRYVDASNGPSNCPLTYGAFCKLFSSFGKPRSAMQPPTEDQLHGSNFGKADLIDPEFDVPTLAQMGYTESPTTSFHGGESEALQRLRGTVTERAAWVRSFEKPNTSPNSLEPSTTVSNNET